MGLLAADLLLYSMGAAVAAAVAGLLLLGCLLHPREEKLAFVLREWLVLVLVRPRQHLAVARLLLRSLLTVHSAGTLHGYRECVSVCACAS